MSLKESVGNWPRWLQTLALLGSAFGICSVCSCPGSLVAVASYLDNHPDFHDRLNSYAVWAWRHWPWALPVLLLFIVLGLGVCRWDWVLWAPRGFAAWMRWRRVDNEVRSRLEGLEPLHWESLVASVRKGEPYQGGRRKVRRADAEKYINSRSRVGTAGWSVSWLAGSLTALSDAGLVSFGQVSPGVFLVRIFPACGSDDRLAEVLDAKLVKKRVWTPSEQVVEEQG